MTVDNRPGFGGVIGAAEAARAAPDGHTLLLGETGQLSIAPGIYSRLPYDVARDFTPVSQAWFGVVARLSDDIQAALKQPAVRASLEQAGFRVAGSNREDFARTLAADTAQWGKAIAASGFKAD